MDYITFFHNSDEYREYFSSKGNNRPCFYWFSEYFHCHINWDDYFYLFVKNPKQDDITFRARHNPNDFDGLYQYYLEYKLALERIYAGEIKYAEPSIMMSFDRIEPDIIAKYLKDTDEFEIIKPESHKGKIFSKVGKDGKLIKFTDIKEIVEIVPEIKNSYPFIEPKKEQDKYIYNDWIPMVTEKNGTWL